MKKRRKKDKGKAPVQASGEDSDLEAAILTAQAEREAIARQAAPALAAARAALAQVEATCPEGHSPGARVSEAGEAYGSCSRTLQGEVVLACPLPCRFVVCLNQQCVVPQVRTAVAELRSLADAALVGALFPSLGCCAGPAG